MEHIEQAGVHSGDSACSLPPYTLSAEMQQRLCEQVTQMALALNVVGLMNTQFAIKGDDVFILEVNPRASRTVPFVSKATGVPLAKVAARCMVGQSLQQQDQTQQSLPGFVSVKESVFPFTKFQGVDPILGPEMKSTGEVIATGGTARALQQGGVACQHVNKVKDGRTHIVDMIKNDEIVLIVNTTEGRSAIADSYAIRREALMHSVSYTTTISGGKATCQAMAHREVNEVYCLQALHQANIQ
jgi:carbamoyl-phosphate synthase large subunit